MISRRILLAAGFAATASTAWAASAGRLRVGYQKSGMLAATRQRGTLEAALTPDGVEVGWSEFPSGPPIMEALRAGAVDIAYAGDAPPIFAQAARADLVYVAATLDGATAAILVPPGSPIQSLAELKGRRVAFAKATSAHNLTVAALEKAKLGIGDIEPVYLAPADAAAAFIRGAVDAWTIWDPYYAIAEAQPGVRVLARSSEITPQNSYLLAARGYARAQPGAMATALRLFFQVRCCATSDP